MYITIYLRKFKKDKENWKRNKHISLIIILLLYNIVYLRQKYVHSKLHGDKITKNSDSNELCLR